MNRKSMYAEFGSKQGLFEAALARYSAINLTRVLAPIEAPDADAASIRQAFGIYASASEGAFAGLGCLMANTAVERAALGPGLERFVQAYLARVKSGFHRALENTRAAGALPDNADLDELADFFAMAIVGVSALIRAKAPPAQVHSACQAAVRLLDRAY